MPRSVLVVEDDPFIRTCTAEMIGECGFRVIEVESADQALKIIQHEAEDIAVIITDVRMPGELDGVALAKLVTTNWPRIHVLVMSGFEGGRRAELPKNVRFMTKPWRAREVVSYILEATRET